MNYGNTTLAITAIVAAAALTGVAFAIPQQVMAGVAFAIPQQVMAGGYGHRHHNNHKLIRQ